MKKQIIVLAAIVAPLFAMAGNKPAKHHAAPAKQAASAPAAAASAPARVKPAESRAAVEASKNRGSAMGGCRQEAADAKLLGQERKAYITKCMAGK